MRRGFDVATQTNLIRLIGCPIDIAFMMVLDEHGPLRLRQPTHSRLQFPLLIDVSLLPALAVAIGTSINRIGEDTMDRMIRRCNPADLVAVMHLQREREVLRAKPQPDAAS